MRHRIRAAAIVVDGDKLLLVKHQHPDTGEVWWTPPGGGVEGYESLFECAARETFEETGLHTDPERIVYIDQYVEPECHYCNLFVLCRAFSGTLTMQNIIGNGEDEQYIKDARFLAREEMAHETVYPKMLKDEFWEDFQKGFPNTRCLGLHRPGS